MKSVWCLIALFLLFSPINAAADTFTLWDYFPDSQGDNGLYAGAWNPTAELPYRELMDAGAYSFTSDGNPGVTPMVIKVASPWVFMQPSESEYAILSGHGDQPELINVSGQFFYIGVDQVKVSIGTITGNTPSNLQEWTLGGEFTTISFNFTNIMVSPDNSLYFAVNADGDAPNDGTLLQGEISPVPAPGALLLLGSGLLGLLGWRQSRKS